MSEPTDEPAATASDQFLAALADEFAARLRRGERPTVEEYVAKHPQLEETIRKAFSAIAMIEESRTADPAASGERLGAMIGRYKLLERIGEGGFGFVYMAEQHHPVRRKVALKVIKPGMDSRQVLARFEAERQALAIMDHPNIAKVLDAGATESGRPYFVMELVKGEPITEFCDRNQLEPRQRLELFVQVCQAVQHAHQKGIIHRDLKPSNVLVSVHDTTPVVKVIDFGVAKALGQELTDNTLFTGFAQLLGTPLYMSPEQAGHSALDIDTRSDIYSLGVLLYELLTGTTPFDRERFRQAAEDEIRRIIREEEPPRPSTRLSESKDSLPSISAQRHTEPAKLTKLVRGELDWIVMKALEKDRTRRYETATGLARDIERHLQDEPVEACPPSTSYRLRKFARRNKGPVLAAAVVLLTLVGGIVGTSVGLKQAVHARDAEARQRVVAQLNESKARDEAARADREAENAKVATAKQTAINQFLNDMLGSANPQALSAETQVKGRDVTILQVMDDAVRRLDADSLKSRPEIEAAVRRTIGNVYHDLAQYAKAESQLRAALEINKRVYGSAHPEVAQSLRDLARCLASKAKRVDAEKMLHDALDMQRNLLGREDAEVATTLYELAKVAKSRGHAQEGAALAAECLQMRQKLLPPEHPDLALILRLVARTRKAGEAEVLLRQALSIQQKALGPEHPEVAVTMGDLARKLDTQGKHDEAARLMVQTLELQRKLFGPDHPAVAQTLIYGASSAEALGRLDAADKFRQEALRIQKKALGEEHPSVVRTLETIALALERQGNLKEAEQLHRELLSVRIRTLGVTSAMVHASLSNLTDNLDRQGRSADAVAEVRRILALREEALGSRRHPDLSPILTLLAYLLIGQPETGEAEGAYRQVISMMKEKGDRSVDKWTVNRLSQGYGYLLTDQERYEEAAQLYAWLLPVLRDAFGHEHVVVAQNLNKYAQVLQAQRKLGEAESLCREMIAILQPAGDHLELAAAMVTYAGVLQASGKSSDAVALSREAVAMCGRVSVEGTREVERGLAEIAKNLERQGHLAEAEAVWQEELKVEKKVSGEDHLVVANSYVRLAQVFHDQRKFAQAEEASRAALKIRRKKLPTTHPSIATALAQLGAVLCEQQRPQQAELVLRECIEIRRSLSPPNKWLLANAHSLLGAALALQERREEAERLLLDAAGDFEGAPSGYNKWRKRNCERLVDLYRRWDKADEAAKWLEKMKAIAPTTRATTAPTTAQTVAPQ